MKNKKPVELWKGIVGTAASGFIWVVTFLVFIIFYILKITIPTPLLIFFIVAIVIGVISFIISVLNLYEAIVYRRHLKELEEQSQKRNSGKKVELLHRLLSEGKITIEEYDELNK